VIGTGVQGSGMRTYAPSAVITAKAITPMPAEIARYSGHAVLALIPAG